MLPLPMLMLAGPGLDSQARGRPPNGPAGVSAVAAGGGGDCEVLRAAVLAADPSHARVKAAAEVDTDRVCEATAP